MKVALCFSGGIRNFKDTFESWIEAQKDSLIVNKITVIHYTKDLHKLAKISNFTQDASVRK